MSIALIIIVAFIGGAAFMLNYRAQGDARRSKGGWYGMGLLALLFSGLWVSGQKGNEPAAYGFGIAMAIVAFLMVLIGISGAAGRFMRKRKKASHPENLWSADQSRPLP